MAEAEANGVRLYYEHHGSGDPLVLVHGSWADATNWALVVPALAEGFQVLVYDRRGHSRSQHPTRRAASTRKATTSPPCWGRSSWRPHTW
ncbi:MAG: alpha/beta fold hydrolase [Solirubrobacterales bacterium]